MKYSVTFARHGYVEVEADSKDEALAKVEGYGTEDVEWSDDFLATDVEETD